jgi:TetR/AcrR family transcriptional regulator, transcriptional repressor for nem operon
MDCQVHKQDQASIVMADQTAELIPPTRKGRETRDRIIDAAAGLIYDRGVAAVSLDDVLDTTGTSKSQLYHYFADKDDLVHAVIRRQRDNIVRFHKPALESLSSWDDIAGWRDMIVDAQRARSCRGGCPLGSLANELAELDETARDQLVDAFTVWEALLADGLDSMVANGTLEPGHDTADLATGVMASLQGGLLLAETTRDIRTLEIALDTAIAYLHTLAT